MRIGFIGAGKVGFTLGKYFKVNGLEVTGYYNHNPKAAREAVEFTDTNFYDNEENLIRDSEVVFLTVPDGVISEVWQRIKAYNPHGKIFCHCSGATTSAVFSDIAEYNCYGYSVHPFFAISDKMDSYKEISKARFTVEGDTAHIDEVADILKKCGNTVVFIEKDNKIRYHAAAVFASNLMLGLMESAMEELMQCGFDKEDAVGALLSLSVNNLRHLENGSIEEALTGPVERCDVITVKRHLENVSDENRAIYIMLSRKALEIAKRKNPDRDYHKMEDILYG